MGGNKFLIDDLIQSCVTSQMRLSFGTWCILFLLHTRLFMKQWNVSCLIQILLPIGNSKSRLFLTLSDRSALSCPSCGGRWRMWLQLTSRSMSDAHWPISSGKATSLLFDTIKISNGSWHNAPGNVVSRFRLKLKFEKNLYWWGKNITGDILGEKKSLTSKTNFSDWKEK